MASLDSYALDKLIERGQLDTSAVAGQGYHRAGYDTWAAWQLLCALVADGELDWPGLVTAFPAAVRAVGLPLVSAGQLRCPAAGFATERGAVMSSRTMAS